MKRIASAVARRPAGLWAVLLLASSAGLHADSTIDPAHPYAYGANVGWVNARGEATNGASIGRYYCTGLLWSATCGWIKLGCGTPGNGYAYANNASGDWGVNHDGAGRLTGYAWGANIGWVTFEQSYGQPRVDLRTGNLNGFVWGANVGWIGLSNAQAFVRTLTLDPGPDSDHDQVPDPYEYSHTNTLTALSGLVGHDADGDGVTDLREALADTDPLNGTNWLRITSLEVAGKTNRLAWTSRPTRLYLLEATNSLSGSGTWMDVGPGLIGPPPASPATYTVTGVTNAPRFYRVKAVVPLSD